MRSSCDLTVTAFTRRHGGAEITERQGGGPTGRNRDCRAKRGALAIQTVTVMHY